MGLFNSFAQLFNHKGQGQGRAARRPARRSGPLRLEALEDRAVPALFGEFKISDDVFNLGSSATATSTNGMSVVVYTRAFSSGGVTDSDIKARLFNASGQQIGLEIDVAKGPLNDLDPAVAMDANGNFVVAWHQQDGAGGNSVLARLYSNTGAERDSAAVAFGNKFARDPDVAMDNFGNVVISYTENASPTDQNVRARRYKIDLSTLNDELKPQGGSFSVSSLSNADETQSSVAMDSSGNFAVAYTSRADSGNHDVKLTRFKNNGTANGTLTIANSPIIERDPSLAMDASGNMVVVYESGSSNTQLVARRVGKSGEMDFTPITSFANSSSRDPEVALRNDGSYVVAFDFSRPGVTSAVRVTEVRKNNTIAAEHLIETAGQPTTNPSVGIDPVNGDFFVSYQRGGNIFGRRGQL